MGGYGGVGAMGALGAMGAREGLLKGGLWIRHFSPKMHLGSS